MYLRILASFLVRSGTLGLSYGCVVCLMYARCRRHRLSPTRLCVVCCMCICALSARHRPRDTRLCWVACVCALSARHMIVLCDSLLLCGDFNLRCQCIAGMLIHFRSGEFWHSADVLFLGEVMPNFSVDRRPFSLTILLLFALCRAGDHGPGPTLCEQTHLG